MRRKTIRKQKRISTHIKLRKKKIRKVVNAPSNPTHLWNSSLNIKQNLESLGVPNLKKIDKLDSTLLDAPKHITVDEEYTLDQIKKINEEDFVPSKPKITQDEKFLVQNLAKKYGYNFEKMVMDHKTNKLQWNANQIKKKFAYYKKKFGEEPI